MYTADKYRTKWFETNIKQACYVQWFWVFALYAKIIQVYKESILFCKAIYKFYIFYLVEYQ